MEFTLNQVKELLNNSTWYFIDQETDKRYTCQFKNDTFTYGKVSNLRYEIRLGIQPGKFIVTFVDNPTINFVIAKFSERELIMVDNKNQLHPFHILES